MTEKLQTILTHFTGVKPVAGDNQYQADCPCLHHKKTNNKHLAITVNNEGKIAVHCFAGCFIDEILSEVGIMLRDLFPEQTDEERQRYRNNIAVNREKAERGNLTGKLLSELTVLQQVISSRFYNEEMDINGRYEAWDREKQAIKRLPKLMEAYYK